MLMWAILAGGVAAAEPTIRADGSILNPSFDKMPEAWQLKNATEGLPPWVHERGVPGNATISCDVTSMGDLENCSVLDESPEGAGFGAAALKLAKLFHLAPVQPNGPIVAGGKVRIPLRFGRPSPNR